MPPSWVGQKLLDGRYEVLRELGRGGMAVVYQARDGRLQTDVVVKVPQAHLLQDAEFTKRFAREVQSLVRLSHPHIVRVMDAGEHRGSPFAVLQLLPGGNLRTRQLEGGKRNFQVKLAELRTWLPQVAAALDYMHRQGFVHRDIKPDNILFDAEGNAYVSDFGIAKALAGGPAPQSLLTGMGEVLGTAQYLPPELILGKPFDGRADQYALAVTVFEVLSGQLPFDGPTLTAIHEQQKQKPPRLDQRNPHVPARAAVAVQQALLADPAQRFKTCEAFAAAVTAAPTSAPAGAGPPPVAIPVARPGPAAPVAEFATMIETATVYCPHCNQKVGVRAKLQGKRARCTHCATSFQVPMLVQLAATERGAVVSPPPQGGRLKWLGCAAFLCMLLGVMCGWGLFNYEELEHTWENVTGSGFGGQTSGKTTEPTAGTQHPRTNRRY